MTNKEDLFFNIDMLSKIGGGEKHFIKILNLLRLFLQEKDEEITYLKLDVNSLQNDVYDLDNKVYHLECNSD